MLKDHEKRIAALEAIISKKKGPPLKAGKNSLSDALIELRDARFFSTPRVAGEVFAKVQTKYPCDAGRVAVALFRLAKARTLRITSKKVADKKYKVYVW